jgi:hypothetical protein
MWFAIRLLILVAFAAHAGLGCCLTHGNCFSWRGSADAGHHCCDQEIHHGAASSISDQADELSCNCFDVPRPVLVGSSEESRVPQQFSCCNHSKCVFVTSDSAGAKFNELSRSVDSFLADLRFGDRTVPSLSVVPCSDLSKIPIPALSVRAMLQVWLI